MRTYFLALLVFLTYPSYTHASETQNTQNNDLFNTFIQDTTENNTPEEHDIDAQLCNEMVYQHAQEHTPSWLKQYVIRGCMYTLIKAYALKNYTSHACGIMWERIKKATTILCGLEKQ